jgi:N-acetylglucosamine kinase-like BadF-type ATPase
VLLISGTGSACYGRNAQGHSWRVGGWGALLDEQGSAHSLGLAAIVAATRAADGRGERTELSGLILKKLSLSEIKEIFRKVHESGMSRAEIAALAPDVIRLAEEGDAVAKHIVSRGAEGLVELVQTVAHRLRMDRPQLALTGGLISNALAFRKRFLKLLAARFPQCALAKTEFEPVFGAVMLACQHATGTSPSPSFLENLRRGVANLRIIA